MTKAGAVTKAGSTPEPRWFLTHFHGDHYGGLKSTWDRGIIHCTTITAALVCDILGVERRFVVAHDLEVPFDVDGVEAFIDANRVRCGNDGISRAYNTGGGGCRVAQSRPVAHGRHALPPPHAHGWTRSRRCRYRCRADGKDEDIGNPKAGGIGIGIGIGIGSGIGGSGSGSGSEDTDDDAALAGTWASARPGLAHLVCPGRGCCCRTRAARAVRAPRA